MWPQQPSYVSSFTYTFADTGYSICPMSLPSHTLLLTRATVFVLCLFLHIHFCWHGPQYSSYVSSFTYTFAATGYSIRPMSLPLHILLLTLCLTRMERERGKKAQPDTLLTRTSDVLSQKANAAFERITFTKHQLKTDANEFTHKSHCPARQLQSCGKTCGPQRTPRWLHRQRTKNFSSRPRMVIENLPQCPRLGSWTDREICPIGRLPRRALARTVTRLSPCNIFLLSTKQPYSTPPGNLSGTVKRRKVSPGFIYVCYLRPQSRSLGLWQQGWWCGELGVGVGGGGPTERRGRGRSVCVCVCVCVWGGGGDIELRSDWFLLLNDTAPTLATPGLSARMATAWGIQRTLYWGVLRPPVYMYTRMCVPLEITLSLHPPSTRCTSFERYLWLTTLYALFSFLF